MLRIDNCRLIRKRLLPKGPAGASLELYQMQGAR